VTKGADVVVHLAANTGVPNSVSHPRLDMEQNVIGTFNYLEAARTNGVKRFVFASSGAPAGEVEPPIHEELAPHPVSPYGASKLAGEGYCSAYARSFGLATVALRFGNVYGPRSSHKGSVVAKFIRQTLAGEGLEVYGDGNQTRDFIYVDDLVAAVWKAATVEGIGGETFQIATAAETTIRELLEQLAVAFGKAGIVMPPVIYTETRKGDVRRNFSDTSKAARMLNWQSQVQLPEGLQRTLAGFLAARGA
jgi:UDP-glucose 4-epimerase